MESLHEQARRRRGPARPSSWWCRQGAGAASGGGERGGWTRRYRGWQADAAWVESRRGFLRSRPQGCGGHAQAPPSFGNPPAALERYCMSWWFESSGMGAMARLDGSRALAQHDVKHRGVAPTGTAASCRDSGVVPRRSTDDNAAREKYLHVCRLVLVRRYVPRPRPICPTCCCSLSSRRLSSRHVQHNEPQHGQKAPLPRSNCPAACYLATICGP